MKKMNENENKKIIFSVAIITFNEEMNIKSCIESIHETADEIIVLDSFSTDKTLEIASQFLKVKIFTNEFKGHIEQKNKAIDLCSGTWILSIDADERISPSLNKEISSILSKNEFEIKGYKIPRLTFHLGKFIKHGGWYPLKRYRFFQKGYAKWTGENPHDIVQINGKGSSLNGDIIHYSFKDLTHQVDTINRFSSIVSFTRFQKKVSFPIIKSIYKPFLKFLESYVFKLGFLDGYAGFIIAISSSYSTFLKFAKLYELNKGYIDRPSNLRKDYGK
jgi:glycosyltransferase involved in cell wall biosynthesis